MPKTFVRCPECGRTSRVHSWTALSPARKAEVAVCSSTLGHQPKRDSHMLNPLKAAKRGAH